MIKSRRVPQSTIDAYDRELLDETTFLTVDQVADRIKFSKSTIRVLTRSGELPAYNRHGARSSCNGVRILAADLREYIRSIRIDNDSWNE